MTHQPAVRTMPLQVLEKTRRALLQGDAIPQKPGCGVTDGTERCVPSLLLCIYNGHMLLFLLFRGKTRFREGRAAKVMSGLWTPGRHIFLSPGYD